MPSATAAQSHRDGRAPSRAATQPGRSPESFCRREQQPLPAEVFRA